MMGKLLSEMTLDELWHLFPIVLSEYNSFYPQWYQDEQARLKKCLAQSDIKRINHIGSSAVKGLISKPTIDILLEVDRHCTIRNIITALEQDEWILMSSETEPELKLVFNKGYTPKGFAEKVYHLHVRYQGDWDELYFRDYLLKHDEVAKEYVKLKTLLLDKYKNNRDGYTEAKSEFILKYTKEAKAEFKNKYTPKS